MLKKSLTLFEEELQHPQLGCSLVPTTNWNLIGVDLAYRRKGLPHFVAEKDSPAAVCAIDFEAENGLGETHHAEILDEAELMALVAALDAARLPSFAKMRAKNSSCHNCSEEQLLERLERLSHPHLLDLVKDDLQISSSPS